MWYAVAQRYFSEAGGSAAGTGTAARRIAAATTEGRRVRTVVSSGWDRPGRGWDEDNTTARRPTPPRHTVPAPHEHAAEVEREVEATADRSGHFPVGSLIPSNSAASVRSRRIVTFGFFCWSIHFAERSYALRASSWLPSCQWAIARHKPWLAVPPGVLPIAIALSRD